MFRRGVVALGKALVAVQAHERKFACAGRSTRDHIKTSVAEGRQKEMSPEAIP